MEDMVKRNGQVLHEKLTDALKTGEIPYQAAHAASRAVDWYDDAKKAQKELNVMVAGIDLFVSDLGDLESAAKSIQKNATAVVR